MALIQFAAVNPGIQGNLIAIDMIPVSGGPELSVNITHPELNQTVIDLSYGFTPGSPDRLVGGGTWATLSATINASAAGAFVTASGDTDTVLNGQVGFNRLQGGTTGQTGNIS
jgi:hypothetical protein